MVLASNRPVYKNYMKQFYNRKNKPPMVGIVSVRINSRTEQNCFFNYHNKISYNFMKSMLS